MILAGINSILDHNETTTVSIEQFILNTDLNKLAFQLGWNRENASRFNKNIVGLAAALEGITCNLVIIGRLTEKQKIELGRKKISYINRHSLSLNELHQEYLKCDLLTFCSFVEGFGLPILEAQVSYTLLQCRVRR